MSAGGVPGRAGAFGRGGWLSRTLHATVVCPSGSPRPVRPIARQTGRDAHAAEARIALVNVSAELRMHRQGRAIPVTDDGEWMNRFAVLGGHPDRVADAVAHQDHRGVAPTFPHPRHEPCWDPKVRKLAPGPEGMIFAIALAQRLERDRVLPIVAFKKQMLVSNRFASAQ